MVIESILIIVALFSFTYLAATTFTEEGYLQQLVSGPWQSLDGMIQNGTWGAPDKTALYHPNQNDWHITNDPTQ